MCPKCGKDNDFYTSVKHMCKQCWSEYQRDRRAERLKDIPKMQRGRTTQEPERVLQVTSEGDWSSELEAGTYVSALIDGEGHISFYSYGNKGVMISNTEFSIIEACAEALNYLRIPYKLRRDKRYTKKKDTRYKDCFTLSIFGQSNFIRLQSFIKLRSQLKAEKLQAMINSYKRREVVL